MLNNQAQDWTKSGKTSNARHGLMLQAMVSIKKVLIETCKIRVADNFYLDLRSLDAQGWPCLELSLNCAAAPINSAPAIIVSANDNNNLGMLRISLNSGEVLSELSLRDSSKFEMVPQMLKNSLRKFMEAVAGFVTSQSASAPGRSTLAPAAKKSNKKPCSTDDRLASLDFFVEDHSEDEKLVPIEEVQPIEGF